MGNDRKRRERWLHARISQDLDEALKREARRRRSPVSLVVRHALEAALDLVEDLVEDGIKVARTSSRLGRHRAAGRLDEVYGWQEVILNREAECARCEADLAIGEAAHRGLRDRPAGASLFLCRACLDRLRRTARKSSQHTEEERP